VYFGVLVFVPKIIKSKFINKKLGRWDTWIYNLYTT
jgi:hypothetical protein